jgi:hypothetical protein
VVEQIRITAIADEVQGIVQRAAYEAQTTSRELSRVAVSQVNANAVNSLRPATSESANKAQ